MKKKSLYFSQNRYAGLIIPGTSAIFLGGMIYLLFHSSEHVFFSWIRSSGLDNWLNLTRNRSLGIGQHLPLWILYSLPDGLWAFSYALFIAGIWWKSGSWLKYFWITTIPALIIGCELLQYNGIIPGTFCLQDLTFEMLGIIAGIALAIKTTKFHNHETKFQ
jgi:hypothetical protein